MIRSFDHRSASHQGTGPAHRARFAPWLASALALAASASQARADQAEPSEPLEATAVVEEQEALEEPEDSEEPGKHSINLSPLGIIFGAYNVNYEYLHEGTHGFLGEFGVAHSSDDDISATSFAGAAGYRWHWLEKQSSGFLGANLGYQRGFGEGSVNGDTIHLDVQRVILVANIGRRWAWDFGLNITFRVGAGYGTWKVSSDSDDPDVQREVERAEDLLALLPIALDGELSLGWVF